MAIAQIGSSDEDAVDEHVRFFRGVGLALIASAIFWGSVACALVLLLR
jgi:hypothetical protein